MLPMADNGIFRTVVDVPKSQSAIHHSHTILCMGSCFAETMGALLTDFLFNACVNPFGILFNPASIAAGLKRLAERTPYAEQDLFFSSGLWHSRDHHGRFSAASRDDCLAKINARFAKGCDAFQTCDVLILTLGTAVAFSHRESGRIAANCHKQPAEQFDRRLLSIEEIVKAFTEVLERLHALRPGCLCIATVSPVRHIRNNAHENLVSKSTLVCALHELEKRFSRLYYFPAYEIMMDELRDYRFYKEDMTHPADVAVGYLWERFTEACLDTGSRQFVREWEPVRNAMGHRTTQQSDDATKAFVSSQLDAIRNIAGRHPEADVGPALEYFKGLSTR